jgi:hypothetical protein
MEQTSPAGSGRIVVVVERPTTDVVVAPEDVDELWADVDADCGGVSFWVPKRITNTTAMTATTRTTSTVDDLRMAER